MKSPLLALAAVMVLVACNKVDDRQLVGKWQASLILEDGMPMPIEPSEVGFEFFANGFYQFRSTLGYKEAGSFKVAGGLLYTLDTINKASTEKAVLIRSVTKDSLFIEMNEEGRIREVKLFRTSN